MIVLDTNVVSEAMKAAPNPAVLAWLDDQAAETLYLSSVTLAELLFGMGALPAGRRKDALAQTLDGLLRLFENRILAFDTDAARNYGELAVKARAAGKGFPPRMATSPPSRTPAGSPLPPATLHRFRRQASPSSTRGRHRSDREPDKDRPQQA